MWRLLSGCAPENPLAKCTPEWVSAERDRNDGKFLDSTFKPSAASLGTPKPGRQFVDERKLAAATWIRLPALLDMNGCIDDDDAQGEPHLAWEDCIEPGDLTQGGLGNCWLVAAIAALAEFPNAVRELFVETDAARGRYVVRLYDMDRAAWENVEIDDYIPCTREDDWSRLAYTQGADGTRRYRHEDIYDSKGRKRVPGKWVPLFGRPTRNRVWALLLEKAMAKFVGCYAHLAGGSEPYALSAFTGFPLVYCFARPAEDAAESRAVLSRWDRHGSQHFGRGVTGHAFVEIEGAKTPLNDKEMWAKLIKYEAQNYLMTSSITKFEQPQTSQGFFRPDGLVLGHAYSMISGKTAVKSNGDIVSLVLLRNPHGEVSECEDGVFASHWTGPWCNGCASWERHPEVAVQVGYCPANDGMFWMTWEDFCSIFDKVCVLPKSMGKPRASVARAQKAAESTLAEALICLEKMAGQQPQLKHDLRQLSVTFDPFASLPSFLDDGSLETRLRWEATKPGRLRTLLDANRGSSAHGMLEQKIAELGLTGAADKEPPPQKRAPAAVDEHSGGRDAMGILMKLFAQATSGGA